jgi:hypothetical protein
MIALVSVSVFNTIYLQPPFTRGSISASTREKPLPAYMTASPTVEACAMEASTAAPLLHRNVSSDDPGRTHGRGRGHDRIRGRDLYKRHALVSASAARCALLHAWAWAAQRTVASASATATIAAATTVYTFTFSATRSNGQRWAEIVQQSATLDAPCPPPPL